MQNFEYAERAKMLQMLRERAAYKDMAFKMQEALKAIAAGEGDAKVIAKQTLDQLNTEHGNGSH
jgi:acetylglutamate kinase